MRFAAVLAAVVCGAIAAAALTPQADARTRTSRFQTPSKNIACLYSSATGRPSYIRCDVLTGLRPKPKRPCEVDWTGFSMTAKSRATATCAGDTVYDRNAKVFPYTWTWKRGGFTCTVLRTVSAARTRPAADSSSPARAHTRSEPRPQPVLASPRWRSPSSRSTV